MEKFSKKRKISEFKDGDRVDDVFFVKFKKGMAPYSKGFSFELTLSDGSGRSMEYKYWGDTNETAVRALYDSMKADSIVRVQGKVALYREKLQMTTNAPDRIEVLKPGQYDEADFVKQAKKNIDEMYGRLLDFVSEVKNPKIKELLSSVFKDKEIEGKFKKHPGAIDIHHNWVGGLMEHVLEVAEYCKKSWELYPQLDKDLLIAGALLHDIGKLEELEVTSRIKGTRKGQLTGHLVLSAVFVSNKCDEAKIDAETKDKLMHIIVSHHGKSEYGAPKEPMFPEALAVYYADELSARLAEMTEFIEESKQSTEDEFMYQKRYNKNVLLK
jgi:3'-5' exoribonuclease